MKFRSTWRTCFSGFRGESENRTVVRFAEQNTLRMAERQSIADGGLEFLQKARYGANGFFTASFLVPALPAPEALDSPPV